MDPYTACSYQVHQSFFIKIPLLGQNVLKKLSIIGHLSQCLYKRFVNLYCLEDIQESRELLFHFSFLMSLREGNNRHVNMFIFFLLQFFSLHLLLSMYLFPFQSLQSSLNYLTCFLYQFLLLQISQSFSSLLILCFLHLFHFLELPPCNPLGSSLCHLGKHPWIDSALLGPTPLLVSPNSLERH